MSRLLEWLLDLDHIRLGDAPLSVKLVPPLEPWLIAVVIVLLGSLLVAVLRRQAIPLRQRVALGVSRGLLLALVMIMLCRPALVLQRERVEPSWVALLVDTSQSMGRREAYTHSPGAPTTAPASAPADGAEPTTATSPTVVDADPPGAASQPAVPIDSAVPWEYEPGQPGTALAAAAGLDTPAQCSEYSRLDLVRRVAEGDEAAVVRNLLRWNQVRLFAFAGEAELRAQATGISQVDPLVSAMDDLSPDGTATDLAAALHSVTESSPGQPLAAVVVMSDGRSTASTYLASAIARLQAAQVPVFCVPVGSPLPPVDVSVGAVEAQENVYPNDLVSVRVLVRGAGLGVPTPVVVRLIDELRQVAVVTETVELGGSVQQVAAELRFRPHHAGKQGYRVEAEPLPGELETEDNVGRVEFRVLDEKLRVLYVEGVPRFEYRYLKNALLREASIESSVLLLSADPDFAQEGTQPIRRFPETPEELNAFDVVVFGDVDPRQSWLSTPQMDMLVEFVSRKGGGFGLVAGEGSAPYRFIGTPLEKLIPVRIDPEFLGHYEMPLSTPFNPVLTPDGRDSRCFRFDRDPQVSHRLFEALPGILWFARTLGNKPGTTVLLEHPTLQCATGPMPLMVMGRYGAGNVLFCATDETWRWRRGNGEFLHDAFWVQTVRSLQNGDVDGDDRIRLTTDRKEYALGERVDVHVQVDDADLLASLGQQTRLLVLDAAGASVARLVAERLDPAARSFEATFVPPKPSGYVIQSEDVTPLHADRPISTSFQVRPADLENRDPTADYASLRRLAEQTGGALVRPDQAAAVLGAIHDRNTRIPDDVTETLWDSKLAFLLFLLIITWEWVMRKAFGQL